MSIDVEAKLLAAAVKALDITVPIRRARVMADGRVLIHTRDGQHVWDPPEEEAAPESVSKPAPRRKRAKPAKKTGGEE